VAVVRLPDALQQTSRTLMPHVLADYMYELAAAFHTFYEACKVVPSTAAAGGVGGVGDDATCIGDDGVCARLRLCAAADASLRVGFHLLGVTAVNRM
jgi:arginyl-tRNA synthetase